MGLRNYQKDFCSRILSHFANGQKRVLAQMPTGGGKTQVFSAIAAKFVSSEKKVLILAHREELIYQAANKIKEVCGIEPGIIKASEKINLRSPIQVASVQTLARRLESSQFKALECDLVVVDEAHHVVCSTYQKILDIMPGAYCLGLTATPSRLDGKGFREVFDEIVCSISPKELIEQGYLSRYKLFADSNPMSTKGLKIANGDYRASDVAKINDAIAVSKNLVESYQKHLQGKRCLVFAINVAHSMVVADAYNKAGVKAVHLDGQTDKRIRKSAIEAFASGELKVLCNVELFTEGTDIPALDGVQIARPTASLAMWLQMVGRVLRPSPEKEYAIILDHTENWGLHGLPTKPRVWTLDGAKDQKEQLQVRSQDGEVIVVENVSATEELEVNHNQELVEIETDISDDEYWLSFWEQLIKVKARHGYKDGWLYYKLLDASPPLWLWQYYGEQRGYKAGWAYHQYQKCNKLVA